MRSLARILVRFRLVFALVFVALAVIFGMAILHVNVNKDMLRYLPVDMSVKQGMDAMKEEFGENALLRVMVKDVPQDQRQQLADDLEVFEPVYSVQYSEDSPLYNQGEYVLYEVQTVGNSYSATAKSAYDAVVGAIESRGFEYWVSANLGNSANALGPIYFFGILMAMIILFVLASSWIEPVLVLITIVIAVAINMGTNVLLPSVSDTTASVGGILQMVLSMDYLIMLMNRYRGEREKNPPKLAMENALTGGVTAIGASSITTVAGLLCLCFMSFTVGADLGIVLAKGVIISLLCVFAVQPALVLACDELLTKTAKPFPRPKMKRLTAFTYKMRIPLLVVFVALFAVGYSLRGVTQIGFLTENNTDGVEAVESVFAPAEQVVVLFETEADTKSQKLVEKYENDSRVLTLSSYQTTVGKPYTASQMAEKMGIGQPLVSMLYYYSFNNGQVGSLSKADFLSYLRNQVSVDLGSMLGEDMLESIDTLADMIDSGVDEGVYTPEEMASAVNKHSVSADTIKLLYLAYRGSHDADANWTLSLDELTKMLTQDVMADPSFDSVFDAKTKKQLTSAREQVESGVDMLRGDQYSRVIMKVPFQPRTEEMSDFVQELRQTSADAFGASKWYLVGSGPMVIEMGDSFPGEFATISIITIVAILLIVFLAFRSFAIPVILVAVIQCAFCWDMILNFALGHVIFYLALLVLQAILMGATIDYAILFTSSYRESRQTMGIRDAIADAYQHSVRTIFMSGGILVVVTGIIGMFADGITGEICLIISEGAFIAVLLVITILPGVLAALDKLVVPRKLAWVPAVVPTDLGAGENPETASPEK